MNFKTMGLLRKPDDPLGRYAVAPAYPAYATLIRQLEGAGFVRREALRPYTRAYVLLFEHGGRQVRVCWATHPAQIQLRAGAPLAVVDIMGVEGVVKPKQGKVVLSLDENPVYVKGRVADVTEIVAGAEIVGGSSYDYSKTQGKNNWLYGYYDGDRTGKGDGSEPSGSYTDDDFEPMQHVQTVWGYEWQGPAKYLKLTREGAHPAMLEGHQVWAVRRWKSPVAGKIRLAGTFTGGGQQGDGTQLRILVDGKPVRDALAGGKSERASVDFDLTVTVKEGSLVDFAVTPGPPGSNLSYDASGFDVRVERHEGE